MSAASAPTSTALALRDGRVVRVRPLTSLDAAALADAITHADTFDLYRRFMGTPPSTHSLVRLLDHIDGVHDVALGAFASAQLVGVAQFDRVDDEPEAELAIEVATSWQRCGLGRTLLSELCVVAHSRGITHLNASYFADNTPLIRLLQSTGRSRWVSTQRGAANAEIDVATDLLTDLEGHKP
jgi:acetyltransferase